MPGKKKVRVAIIGVGNCASSLVQGVQYYRNAKPTDKVPGLDARRPGRLPHPRYRVHRGLRRRQGQGRRGPERAIWAYPNNTIKFADVPRLGVQVSRGMTHDGLGRYLSEKVEKAPGPDRRHRRASSRRPRPMSSSTYLPVGSEMATKWYVEQVLEAGCAFVNCIPVFIASSDYWADALRRARPADHRRRHQEPGRRHHHAPRADRPVR